MRLRLSFSLDALDADLERLLDFFDKERLRDFFDRDLLRDFFDKEQLRDRRFEDDLCLPASWNLATGEREADFLAAVGEGDRDSVERFDSEEDLDRDERFVRTFGDDFFVRDADLDDRRLIGDADFLPCERDLSRFLSRGDGDLEDLLPNDGDLVHDLDADLEYDMFSLLVEREHRFDLARDVPGNGGDSLGERSFIIVSSREILVTCANVVVVVVVIGEREDDCSPLFIDGSFLNAIGESFFPELLGGDLDDR